MVVTLTRTLTPVATYGRIMLPPEHPSPIKVWRTLELPWKDNQPRVSCIPEGAHEFSRRYSPHNGCEVFTGVHIEGRSYINIEAANYVRQLLGCIALGKTIFDLDGDGIDDTAHSKQAFREFMDAMTGINVFTLRITQ